MQRLKMPPPPVTMCVIQAAANTTCHPDRAHEPHWAADQQSRARSPCNNEYSFVLQESQRSACVSAFALLAFLRRSRGGACNSLGPQDLGICLTCGYPATSFNALTAVLGLPGAIRSRTMLPWLLHDYLILICTPRLTPLPASFCYGSPDPVAAIREVVRAVAAVGGRVAPAKSLCHLNI